MYSSKDLPSKLISCDIKVYQKTQPKPYHPCINRISRKSHTLMFRAVCPSLVSPKPGKNQKIPGRSDQGHYTNLYYIS